MTAPAIERPLWTWRRWWLLIALTFCVQLGLILWLGEKSPPRVRLPRPAPKLAMADKSSAELIALSDPTLFALPHSQGFSGPAWLTIPPAPSHSFEWTEEPQWLAILPGQFGKDAEQFFETNQTELLPALVSFDPEPTVQETALPAALRDKSGLRMGEGLARRRLKTAPNLPSWPSGDMLTNTIVQLVVNEAGGPVAEPLMLSSSGSKAADDYALAQASAARFEPIANEGPGRTANPVKNLTWGTMIFEWHTLPMSATNTPSTSPPQ